MLLSELIKELTDILNAQGDLETLAVCGECHGCKSGPVMSPEVINNKVYIDGVF